MNKNNITKNIDISIDNMIKRDYIFSLITFIVFTIPRVFFIHQYLDFLYLPNQIIIYLYVLTFFTFFLANYKLSRTLFFISVITSVSINVLISGGLFQAPSSWYVMAIFLFFYYLRNFNRSLLWSAIFTITITISHFYAITVNTEDYPKLSYLHYYDIFFSCIFMTYFSYQIRQRFRFLFEKFQKVSKLQNILSSIFHHDLANSFTGVQLNLKLKNDDECYDGIGQIIDLSKNASQVANALNQEKIKTSRFELLESINSVIYKYKHLFATKNIEVKLKSFQEKIYIHGEPTLFSTSIMMNLLSNAVKFSKNGSSIKINIEEDSMEYIKFIIQDTGIGIPKSMQKNLFNMSYSNSRIGTQNEAGNGFGLVIVKSILDSWGASISVSSIDNIGTIFTIKFLRARD